MPFQKGESGNPAGRPKTPQEFKELAKKNAPAALRQVIAILKGKETSDRDKLKAAEMIMDRAWGKASQPLTGEDGGPLVVVLNGELEKWSK